ncbi:hypothetical protein HG530_010144 [Fusarium avenaceum]|nr:hypothetical protein HG530_010144 [Fusarium avenaceum]
MGSAAVFATERRDPHCFQLPFTRRRSTRMHISDDFQTLCERVQTMVRQRRRKEKRSMEISEPFNFVKNPVDLPGVSSEQLAMLREHAAAGCIGIADPPSPTAPRSPCSTSSLFSNPARPPMKSVATSNSISSTDNPTGVHVKALGANTLHLPLNAEQLDLCALLLCPLLKEHPNTLLRLVIILHQESQGVVTACSRDDATVDALDGTEGIEKLCLALRFDGDFTRAAHLSDHFSHRRDLLWQLRDVTSVECSNQLLVTLLQLIPELLGFFGVRSFPGEDLLDHANCLASTVYITHAQNHTLGHGHGILENLNIPRGLAVDELHQRICEASRTRLRNLAQRLGRETSVPARSIDSSCNIEARADLTLSSAVSRLCQVMQCPLPLIRLNIEEVLR